MRRIFQALYRREQEIETLRQTLRRANRELSGAEPLMHRVLAGRFAQCEVELNLRCHNLEDLRDDAAGLRAVPDDPEWTPEFLDVELRCEATRVASNALRDFAALMGSAEGRQAFIKRLCRWN